MENPAYRALALQTSTRCVSGLPVADARAAITAAIARVGAQVRASRAWIGTDLRLVVLPEYVLTGFPLGDPVPAWLERAALAPGGAEYEALGEIARDQDVHLAGNAYESDPHFPDLYFQASFVIDPAGEVVLRGRRLYSMYSPTPYDVWDRYLDAYGPDSVLPVARTEIGNLAAISSEEILYPELARALALRGAEVLCHPTSEASSPVLPPKAVARRARAIENLAYVVSANSGGLTGIPIPADSTSGGSEIIDFEGRALAQAGPGESLVAAAELDLGALRRNRARPGMANLLARAKPALWAAEYAKLCGDRPNELGETAAVPDRGWFAARQRDTIERLRDAGVVS
ncbi:nitrilase-related carbon-nitrogen hydrolase [Actinomadura sp. BRA 177]|uniref:nitrilase-related carbon-nitrogen hydrolase n=1 Tax=Actinomadura sp. BRA 177 TaxID=2745202 RepID=UPI00159562E0|nr:nitrilase-related carbon-nitrogen hydrolase [Actinomadura sp. BRA 177]NVI92761.1 nitrilase [Actinomadura sp. BRA 177]